MKKSLAFFITAGLLIVSAFFLIPNQTAMPEVFGIRLEFIIFAATLLGIALYHQFTTQVALIGLLLVFVLKESFTDFNAIHHLSHEWRLLLNLFGLLLGFAVLARHFEESHLPDILPRYLPSGWKGGFLLLCVVFVLSSFLDNIAAAMIGGTMAKIIYRHRLHIGYLAAIVAASNAGGSGSVIGDTTTTMMWLDGVPAKDLLTAYVGAGTALAVSGLIAAHQQESHAPLFKNTVADVHVDAVRVFIVILILVGAITANVFLDFPAAGVWFAILIGACLRKTHHHVLHHAFKGSVFLLALVLSASMMPVDELPTPGWKTALTLGFVSSVFDNIPLTKLALDQGGYDWDFLAYAVGFGGSMLWFGSSAGVALSGLFPQAKSVAHWLRHGWHVTLGYAAGFFAMLWLAGWEPHPPHREEHKRPLEIKESPDTPTIKQAPQH